MGLKAAVWMEQGEAEKQKDLPAALRPCGQENLTLPWTPQLLKASRRLLVLA